MRIKSLFLLAVMIIAITFTTNPARAEERVYVKLIEKDETFSVQDISIKFLPLMFYGGEKWIVEPVMLSGEEKDKILKIYYNAAEILDESLMQLPMYANDNFVMPSVVISLLKLTEIKSPGKTLAWYSSWLNQIILTHKAFSLGEKELAGVLAHELGHWVWHNVLSEDEKLQYRELAGQPDKCDRILLSVLGLDGYGEDVLIQEWFAEDFRMYAAGLPDGEYSARLGRSKGDPERLQEFFNRFVE